MDRRGFLRVGLVGAGASTAGCATTPHALSEAEIARHMRRLDRSLDAIEESDLGLSRCGAARFEERQSVETRLFRSSIRALLLTSGINDLGKEARQHPEAQTRLRTHAPEIDYAIAATTARLQAMSEEDFREVQRQLAASPELVEDLADRLDAEAAAIGVPLKRRAHLRSIVRHVDWRLRKQSASLVAGEAVAKTTRLTDQFDIDPDTAIGDADAIAYWSSELERAQRVLAPVLPEDEATPDETDDEQTTVPEAPPAAADSSEPEAPTAEAAEPSPAPAEPPPALPEVEAPFETTEIAPREPLVVWRGSLSALVDADTMIVFEKRDGTEVRGQLTETRPAIATLVIAGKEVDVARRDIAAVKVPRSYFIHTAKERRRRGMILVGTGAGATALGATFVGVGVPLGIIGLAATGGFLLTAAAVLLIVGAIFAGVNARRLRDAEEQAHVGAAP